MISTLTLLAAATMASPTFAHAFHSPVAAHERTLSLICAGVLLVLFVGDVAAVPPERREEERPAPRVSATTAVVLASPASPRRSSPTGS